ncbi:MAG: hypothetical protein Q7S53_02420 [bacterium]|nr:hypothetical protein [bacterium]
MEDLNWKMLIVPVIILFVFIGGIIGIVNWQKSKKELPVVTTVNLPEGEVQSAEKELTVSGKVSKGDEVFINDQEANVEKDGSYSKVVTLNEGENKIVVKEKRNGKEVSTIERTVKYTAPVAQTPATPSVQNPVVGQPSTPVAPTAMQAPSNLSTSGPEEVIIPVVGMGGVVLVVAFYFKSKKQLALNLRK